jgi:molybdopterin-guanine dinucleotide biosynthesis protein A
MMLGASDADWKKIGDEWCDKGEKRMKYPCTGVILAGGLATRFSGRNKAFLKVGGKTILDRIYEVYAELFDEIILITNDPTSYLKWDLMMGTDLFSVRSSLTGLHAGLFYASNPYAFFSASDTPFLNRPLVEIILKEIEKDPDVIIPDTLNGLEPLCAVYAGRCFKHMESNIIKEKFRIRDVLRKLRVIKMSEKKLRGADPDLLGFFNINTPEDLKKANQLIRK